VFTVTMNSTFPASAFQKPVVRFVFDDTQLGQRVAHREGLDDFSNKFGVVA
jgi:hypothetical protein